MFSTLLVGLVLSTASVVTTASPIDVATSGDGITCEPLFAVSYSDCVNDYHRLHDNGGITVDIGEKGHLDPLRTGTVELHLDETWDDSCKGQVKWGEVATLMKSVMDKCRRISDDSGKTAGGAVLRPVGVGKCGSTLYVGKQLKN